MVTEAALNGLSGPISFGQQFGDVQNQTRRSEIQSPKLLMVPSPTRLPISNTNPSITCWAMTSAQSDWSPPFTRDEAAFVESIHKGNRWRTVRECVSSKVRWTAKHSKLSVKQPETIQPVSPSSGLKNHLTSPNEIDPWCTLPFVGITYDVSINNTSSVELRSVYRGVSLVQSLFRSQWKLFIFSLRCTFQSIHLELKFSRYATLEMEYSRRRITATVWSWRRRWLLIIFFPSVSIHLSSSNLPFTRRRREDDAEWCGMKEKHLFYPVLLENNGWWNNSWVFTLLRKRRQQPAATWNSASEFQQTLSSLFNNSPPIKTDQFGALIRRFFLWYCCWSGNR